jgi:hypothetical protein
MSWWAKLRPLGIAVSLIGDRIRAASRLGSESHRPLEAAQKKISCAREHSRSCRSIW